MTQKAAPTLTIYTHPECPYSSAAKGDFDQSNIEYHEIDISIHPEAMDELMRLTDGERITPVIVDGDDITIGYYGVG